MRALCVCLLASLVSPGPSVAAAGRVSRSADGSARRQSARPQMPPTMTSPSQVIAEAERIRGTYGAPPPRGSAVDDAARRRASDYYSWLSRAGSRYRSDLTVSDALMRTYGAMGDYYSGYYPAYAWRGYVGANQWARRRWLYDVRTAAAQRDMERYGEAWAALSYANGSWFWRPTDLQESQGADPAPGLRETAVELVPLPRIDESGLSAADKEAWEEVRTQFTFVSSRVHQARVLLEGLASRLQGRGLSVNPKDGATALSMQGFLVDATDLIKEHDFARAKEALTRSDYERNKLRSVTGQ